MEPGDDKKTYPRRRSQQDEMEQGHGHSNVPPLSLAAYSCKDIKGQGKAAEEEAKVKTNHLPSIRRVFPVHFIVEAIWAYRLDVLSK